MQGATAPPRRARAMAPALIFAARTAVASDAYSQADATRWLVRAARPRHSCVRPTVAASAAATRGATRVRAPAPTPTANSSAPLMAAGDAASLLDARGVRHRPPATIAWLTGVASAARSAGTRPCTPSSRLCTRLMSRPHATCMQGTNTLSFFADQTLTRNAHGVPHALTDRHSLPHNPRAVAPSPPPEAGSQISASVTEAAGDAWRSSGRLACSVTVHAQFPIAPQRSAPSTARRRRMRRRACRLRPLLEARSA